MPGFDPSAYLSKQVASISMDGAEPESNLYEVFDKLFNHLDELAQEIEGEVQELQHAAFNMENSLFRELDVQTDRLNELNKSVDFVKASFEHASEGAVRVGGRLGVSDKEKQNIDKSLELLSYITFFESLSPATAQNILSMNAVSLRKILPATLQSQDWFTLSRTLHELKSILNDINAEQVQHAQKVVLDVADVVEIELLGQFDSCLDEIISRGAEASDADGNGLIARARSLSDCLHLFNNGAALQKRYIFNVIQRRIPADVVMRNDASKGGGGVLGGLKKVIRTVGAGVGVDVGGNTGDDDDNSSAGASANNEDEAEFVAPHINAPPPPNEGGLKGLIQGGKDTIQTLANYTHAQNQSVGQSMHLLDVLSGLFATINEVCIEQFSLIQKVFPTYAVARVTRLLVMRVFSDPLFGIQARVDAILSPRPPTPPLPLPDYLDALVTVREKLNALYVLLLSCAGSESLRGMGSESESLRRAKGERRGGVGARGRAGSRAGDGVGGKESTGAEGDGVGGKGQGVGEGRGVEEEDAEERARSEMEIREFFEEQISQVLSSYVSDYFEKELLHVRTQCTQLLKKAVEEGGGGGLGGVGRISGGTLLTPPVVKWEKLKSVSYILKTVMNRLVFSQLLNIVTDACVRMESIGGREDGGRRLPPQVQALYLLLLQICYDGVVAPCLQAAVALLTKQGGGNTGANSPPLETFQLISVALHVKIKLKSLFDDVFTRPLAVAPNSLLVCKEGRRRGEKGVVRGVGEVLGGYLLCVKGYMERLLTSLQSKYDYAPRGDGGGRESVNLGGAGAGCTAACDALCKVIITLCQAIRNIDAELKGGGIPPATLYQPLTSLIVGTLLSHLRRLKVTPLGWGRCKRDIVEYKHVLMLCRADEGAGVVGGGEGIDMMNCLLEIGEVYAVDETDVVRYVLEDLRHLDAAVVLGLVRSRADFKQAHWARELSAAFMNYKWDSPLAWEKKGAAPVSLQDLLFPPTPNASAPSPSPLLGPTSLRRSGAAPPPPLFADVKRAGMGADRRSVSAPPRKGGGTGAIALDTRLLESGDLDLHIRAAETDHLLKTGVGGAGGVGAGDGVLTSRFLPSRPDDLILESTRGRSLSAASLPMPAPLVRPDLLQPEPVSRRGSGKDASSGAVTSSGGSGAAPKPNPILAARKSNAAAAAAGTGVGNNNGNGAAIPPSSSRDSIGVGVMGTANNRTNANGKDSS
eukprot:gene33224-40198_t